MVENIFLKILFFVFIGVVVYIIYDFFYHENLKENLKCNIDNYDIDDLVVIKGTPEYSNLINDLIDKKSFIFSDDQLKVLKNPQQIFNISENENNQDISNISNVVYLNCKNELKKNTFDFNDENINENINENVNIGGNINENVNEKFDNLIDVSDKEYENIKNMLKNDINQLINPNCFNTGVLKNNIPPIKNYLKNYYQDLYGNKIDAELKDYFIAYYTLINNNNNVGLPVNTLIGTSDFIIPDQYNYDSHFTNAYNIDWNRIINPISYS